MIALALAILVCCSAVKAYPHGASKSRRSGVENEFRNASDTKKKPYQTNLLFIMFDDLRVELSIYGKYGIISPNFERLAARSASDNAASRINARPRVGGVIKRVLLLALANTSSVAPRRSGV